MANFNIDSEEKRTYDAIVIGSGASGGWAAKELCEKGLKVLVLERGREVKHGRDYPTASKAPWQFDYRGTVPIEKRTGFKNARFLSESILPFMIKDDEQPYVQEKPFQWFRGYHMGGKSMLWARQTQRWSDFDFEGPKRDGFAVDWPIRYKDLAPWYEHVEKFAGIAGSNDGLAELPDSVTMKGFNTNCIEDYFKESVKNNYEGRYVIQARCAHLTDPQEIHKQQGRSKCMHQNQCFRGCLYGGYFSSNSSTLPWAEKTGNLTIRPHSVVHSIIHNDKKKKKSRAEGVRVIDAHTNEMIEFYSKIVFVNASTINSNAILLNSTSKRFPEGLGNENGLLGKYMSWHNYRGKASAEYEGFRDKKTSGRRASHAYMPRFRNVFKQETNFLRGYAAGISGSRGKSTDTDMIGGQLRDNILNPKLNDNWNISSWMMGEVVPTEENHVRLHKELKDKYGIPQIVISCDWTENDDKMVEDYMEQTQDMFEKAGFVNIEVRDTKSAPGSDIHEMGGVRMGHDPKTSILNKWNQMHACKNVFVTDGACMTSTSCQNPTLTFMAITARAANYAVEELKKQNI
ncbi:choline dehydrogenase-like flavoprotein [Saonia flava]|uniref:Choline dehydrogenase-like flavoprotein n=1 Tax=Saonia flava TaxID=523696 RepID=A0A846QRJ1_9FLAO|nr:GMC family oxidoreductase [Saonia flava]NJB69600.1 choline dehydrogenase-like flavoprotein [Saonia flava]